MLLHDQTISFSDQIILLNTDDYVCVFIYPDCKLLIICKQTRTIVSEFEFEIDVVDITSNLNNQIIISFYDNTYAIYNLLPQLDLIKSCNLVNISQYSISSNTNGTELLLKALYVTHPSGMNCSRLNLLSNSVHQSYSLPSSTTHISYYNNYLYIISSFFSQKLI